MSAKQLVTLDSPTNISADTDLMSLLLNKPITVEQHAIKLAEHTDIEISHPAPNKWKVTVTFTAKGRWVLCGICGEQSCPGSQWVTD